MAINLRVGRFAASQIVQDMRGNWTMQAERDVNTGPGSRPNVHLFLPPPPYNQIPYGLVSMVGAFGTLGPETELLPANFQLDTVLGAGDVGTVQIFCTTYFGSAYSYQGIDVPGMTATDIPQGIRFDDAIRVILRYLQNSEFRTDL